MREWLFLKPDLEVSLQIPHYRTDIPQFLTWIREFQNLYKTLWREDSRFLEHYHQEQSRFPFFQLDTFPADDERERSLAAAFIKRRNFDGFEVWVEDFTVIDGRRERVENGDGEVLVAELHALTGDVQPWTDDDISDSDDSSDSSTSSSGNSSRDSSSNTISDGSSSDEED
jgi:hypothetical protein